MATKSTPTAPAAVPVPAPDPVPEPAPDAKASPWTNWRYVGPAGRIYTNVPVTPSPGDIVRWAGPISTDGAWVATTDPVTRQPDNWRPEPEVTR